MPKAVEDHDVRDYVNAVFTERQRAVDAALEQTQRALDKALDSRQHDLDATFEQRDEVQLERQRVLDTKISQQRAYFEAILTEHQHASDVAAAEREKAAAALRTGLEAAIHAGDERLREHILNQVEQIRAALASGELLEMERIELVSTEITALRGYVAGQFEEKQKALDAALTAQKEAVVKAEVATDRIAARAQTDQEGLRADMQERLAAVRRELEQATAAQKEAVLKAEAANEKRFESTNEWRGQSLDRERSQAEQRAKLESTFMQREVADVQFADLRKQINDLQKARNLDTGEQAGRSGEHTENRAALNTNLAAAALGNQLRTLYLMVAGLFISGVGVLVTALATHGFSR